MRRKGPEKELQLETFPVDCRRQLALSVVHKGNTRLGRDEEKTKRKQNKAKKDEAGKQGKRELSNMKLKLLTYRFHKRVLC